MSDPTPFVDFMIVGAMKSGTTTLANILKTHDKILFCSTKEPQFFSESPNWCAELDRYRSFFPEMHPGEIVGEASTGYTMFPEYNKNIWDDIYAFNPKMKIIYIMRDPIARVVSHYIHSYTRGYTRSTLDKAICKEPAFINRTRYYAQIKPYIDVFGRKQIFLLTLEKFLLEREEVLAKVANFLEIENHFKNYQYVHSNKAKQDINITLNRHIREKVKNPLAKKLINAVYKKIYGKKFIPPEVTHEIETIIWRLLEQDIDNIEREMGRKLTEWSSCVKFKYNA